MEQGDAVELRMVEHQIAMRVPLASGSTQYLALGSVAAIRVSLEQGYLSAQKIEWAIETIEDLIMPAMQALPEVSVLRVEGPELTEVLQSLAHPGESVATSAVEALFNQLADVASGAPLRARQVSTEPGFVLALVLLREVMHHGGFSSVSALHN